MDIVNTFLQMQFVNNGVNLSKENQMTTVETKSSFNEQFEKVRNNKNNEFETKKDVESKTKNSEEVRKDFSSNNKVKEKISSKQDKPKEKVSKENTEKEILEEISEQTGKSLEEIVETLEKMGLTAFDLTEIKNLNNFVQELLGFDSPVDMLVSDEAMELVEKISNVIEKYEEIINEFKTFDAELLEVQGEISEGSELSEVVSEETESSENEIHNENLIQNEVNADDVQIKSNEKSKNETYSNQENDGNFNQETFTYVPNAQYVNNEVAGAVNIQQQLADAVHNVSGSTQVRSSGDTAQIINQITEQIKVEVKSDTTEMTMVLNPKHLGELTLKVAAENNIVTAEFVVENQKVKEVIEANFNSLKDTLQQMGLEVNELSVSVEQNNSEAKQHFEQNRSKSRRRIEQIISGISSQSEEDDEEKVNPYNLSDNQIDYLA